MDTSNSRHPEQTLFLDGLDAAIAGKFRVAPRENGFFANKEWYEGFDSVESVKQRENSEIDAAVGRLNHE